MEQYGNASGMPGQQNDYKEDTSAQDYRKNWQKIAQSKWTTIGIVLFLVVIAMMRQSSAHTSAVSFAMDNKDIGVVSPNVSIVCSQDEVESFTRVSTAEWEQGEVLLEHVQSDNTIEADCRNAAGEYLLMIYPSSPDIIVLRYAGKTVAFNGQNAEETDEWYQQLKKAMPQKEA